jgi:hypothetical protein
MTDRILVCVAAIVISLLALERSSHADPAPAMDRQLVERMVRALEDQARATNKLVSAVERCKR